VKPTLNLLANMNSHSQLILMSYFKVKLDCQ